MNSSLLMASRLAHVASALFNLAFIYTPLHEWPQGFAVVQFITMPLLVITGMAMTRARKKTAMAA